MIIHPTALVDSRAELGAGVDIGPYAVVEAGAVIGDRTRVMAHAVITGFADIGADCEVHMGAVVGHDPQIRGFDSPGGRLTVGPRTIIREHVTIHRSRQFGGRTLVGADVFLLAGCHIAHDCCIGDHVTIANRALLAGSVTVGRGAFISGNVVIHQFVRIGDLAMIGGQARVVMDAPPYSVVVERSTVRAVNTVGLRRAGLSADARRTIHHAFRLLYRSGLNVSQAADALRDLPATPEICVLLDFIAGSTRGLCPGRWQRRRARLGLVDEPVGD